jgi:hypothetical protein
MSVILECLSTYWQLNAAAFLLLVVCFLVKDINVDVGMLVTIVAGIVCACTFYTDLFWVSDHHYGEISDPISFMVFALLLFAAPIAFAMLVRKTRDLLKK